MNKVILSLLLASSTCSLFSSDESYFQVRESLKEGLYYSQQGLMRQSNYYAFIEPYLQEAENTLHVIQHLKKHPESIQFKFTYDNCLGNYLSSLIGYSGAHFNRFVNSSFPSFKVTIREFALSNAIEKVKNELGLEDLNVEEEFQKTISLLEKSNEHYYKQLGVVNKFRIWFVSSFFM